MAFLELISVGFSFPHSLSNVGPGPTYQVSLGWPNHTQEHGHPGYAVDCFGHLYQSTIVITNVYELSTKFGFIQEIPGWFLRQQILQVLFVLYLRI
jgi:hypothetical protein